MNTDLSAHPKPGPPAAREDGSRPDFFRRFPRGCIAVLLLVATVAVFAPVRNFPMITMDDPMYAGNPKVRSGLTMDGVQWAFTTFFFSNWHPLAWISLMLDAELPGAAPGTHHLVQILFHGANGVLLFLLLTGMTGDPWKSGFVAALFALHPLHVEPVAWVSGRKDVLCAFFLFLAMMAYGRYARHPSLRAYFSMTILFALALMSKPMAVTFPFLLMLMDWWPLGRLREKGGSPPAMTAFAPASPLELLAEKIPLLLLSAASSVVTYLAQSAGGALNTAQFLPPGIRLANAAVSCLRYVGMTIWPTRLAIYYPHPGSSVVGVPLAASLVFLAGVSALSLLRARRVPSLTVGWLWFLGTLIPVIGLVQVGEQAMADRYTYIPLIGLFLAAAWGLPRLVPEREWRGKIFAILAISALLAAAWQTRTQIGHWRSSMALYRHALEVTQNNWLLHNNIGVLYEEQKDLDAAIRHYREAVRINPDYPVARKNLGGALNRRGDYGEGIPQLREALRIDPDFADAKLSLGMALHRTGNFGDAIRLYEEILASDPGNPEARRLRDIARRAAGGR